MELNFQYNNLNWSTPHRCSPGTFIDTNAKPILKEWVFCILRGFGGIFN